MYKIIIEKVAEKFIRKQEKSIQQKLYDTIRILPQGTDIRKLKGFKNKYRCRINNFRIVYDKYDDIFIIDVIKIDNRGDVYKNL